ncbi:type IV pilus assembly protein PilM [Glaciibacter psychrotolerans]|uniref:Type IV pilus assembly protein PilM n=1 Tax=Glaciibacter psychrotolerans TaxID=670054 RepID=A0A7Z0EH45_9MICO|nr:type IV pilus assembly protein PilM [Leifsonia psychrotolerans]NYJ21528.1 type IV pilus assembly protein PilM [Leifsonia psychrotolerans]
MASSVVGIDIGSSTVRAVEVVGPAKAKPTLARYFEVPLPDGAVSRGEVLQPKTVAKALTQLWSQGGFTSKDVVLGMGNQRVLARDLTVQKMSLKHIRESLPFVVQEMLPLPVADALLDFYPVSEAMGENGPVVKGLLIAAVKDAVLANVKAMDLAGLNTVDVDLVPFALTRALISRAGVSGLVALIDIGANTTSVVITQNGVPQFVRIIPTGGADVTAALRGGLETSSAAAEGIKRTLGLAAQVASLEEKQAVEIIYQVTSEQLTSLRNTLNYFANTRPGEPIKQIVLSGGGAQLRGLPTALSEMTQLQVTPGDPSFSVTLAKSIDATHFRAHVPTYSVALGLALGRTA